jgi:hypothetical protein
MSTGLILIGYYSQQHYTYTSISTWSSTLLIILGFILFIIGIYGYDAITKMKKKNIRYHIMMLLICLVLMIIACIGFFWIASTVDKSITENWEEIHESLEDHGFNIRKSFLINQIEVNLKFAGYFSCVFIVFLIISLSTSIYQMSII